MEDPQAVAQAAIAKFVEKYVLVYVCAFFSLCGMCEREQIAHTRFLCVFSFFFGQSWSTAGTVTYDDHRDQNPQSDGWPR